METNGRSRGRLEGRRASLATVLAMVLTVLIVSPVTAAAQVRGAPPADSTADDTKTATPQPAVAVGDVAALAVGTSDGVDVLVPAVSPPSASGRTASAGA